MSGAGLAGAPAIVVAYGIGAGSVAIAGQVITYTVTAAVNVAAGIPIFIEFSGLTNPAAGSYTTAIATNTAAPAVIDSGTTPALVFAASNTAKTIVVAQSLTFTLDTTAFTLNMDPSLPALADQTYTSNITILTNANSGYTLTVSDSATGLAECSSGKPNNSTGVGNHGDCGCVAGCASERHWIHRDRNRGGRCVLRGQRRLRWWDQVRRVPQCRGCGRLEHEGHRRDREHARDHRSDRDRLCDCIGDVHGHDHVHRNPELQLS